MLPRRKWALHGLQRALIVCISVSKGLAKWRTMHAVTRIVCLYFRGRQYHSHNHVVFIAALYSYIKQCLAHITCVLICANTTGWRRPSYLICYFIVISWCPEMAKMCIKAVAVNFGITFCARNTSITDKVTTVSTLNQAFGLRSILLLPHLECNSIDSLNPR